MTNILRIQDDTGVNISFIDDIFAVLDEGLKLPPAKKKDTTAGPVFGVHGKKIIGSIYSNRTIKIIFALKGSDYDAILQSIMTLNDTIDRARERNSEDDKTKNVELVVQIKDSTNESYFRILSGSLKIPENFWSVAGINYTDQNGEPKLFNLELTLEAEPFAYSSSTLNTWDSSSGDRPAEVALQNINSTGYDSGGVEVDNTFDATRQNFVSLLGSSTRGDKKTATTLVIENSSASYEDLGKCYIGAVPGNYFFTLSANIDDSETTLVLDEEVYFFGTPLVLLIESEELLVTSKVNSSRTLTVVRGHNSTTPAAHTIDKAVSLLSLNPVLEAEDGDFTDLGGNDAHTNTNDASASSAGEYEYIELQDEGVKSVVSWTLTQDQVAAQKGLVRIFGRMTSTGQSGGRYWHNEINYRLKFFYTGRSGNDTLVYTTDWKSPQTTTVQLFDFGSVTIPPFGFPGNTNIAGLKIMLQVQIKPDYVLDEGLDPIVYEHNFDYLYLFPIEYGYRVIETRNENLARGDKIVDSGWQDLAYVEQIESYPSGDSLGRASILNAYMSAIQLAPNEDHRIYFLQESTSGLTNITRSFKLQVFTVGTFLNMVY